MSKRGFASKPRRPPTWPARRFVPRITRTRGTRRRITSARTTCRRRESVRKPSIAEMSRSNQLQSRQRRRDVVAELKNLVQAGDEEGPPDLSADAADHQPSIAGDHLLA